MSAASIQAKIKKGLAKAVNKTGSPNSLPVYLIDITLAAGTPLSPASPTETPILLPNAIFKEYDAKTLDVNILAGDRELVCDNSSAIRQGDIIEQGSSRYIVISVSIKAPTSDVLAYIAQVRLK